jgi:hypothetical protein
MIISVVDPVATLTIILVADPVVILTIKVIELVAMTPMIALSVADPVETPMTILVVVLDTMMDIPARMMGVAITQNEMEVGQDMMMTMGTSVMMDNEAIIVMIHNMMRVITLMAITHRAHTGMTIHIRRATDHHHIIHRLGPDDLLDRQ